MEKLNRGRFFVLFPEEDQLPNIGFENWPVAWVWKIWIMGNIGCQVFKGGVQN